MTELERTKYLRDLRRQMVALFNLGELSTLAFDLSVDWDSLEGGNIESKVQSLILYLARRGRLDGLVTLLREERPDANWPQVPSSGQQRMDENEITPVSILEATLHDYLRTMRSLLIDEEPGGRKYGETTLAIARELTDAVMLRLDKPRLEAVVRFLGSRDLASIVTATEIEFTGVNYIGVNLQGVGFNRAMLQGARFFQANLSNADLSEANLTNADLGAANLTGANLFGAILDHADMSETILTYADLSGAQLLEANLSRARLLNANLRRATLRGAVLSSALLDMANLVGADLERAYSPLATLRQANLRGANLNHVHLSDADLFMAQLVRANLSGADLGGTKLHRAILIEAKLVGADLSDSILRNADLSRADLTGADLLRSDLTEASLVGADLTAANLNGATGWTIDQLERAFIYNTTMPDGLYIGHVAPSQDDDKPPKKGYSFDEWEAHYRSSQGSRI